MHLSRPVLFNLKMLSAILPECQGGHEGDWWSRCEPSGPSAPGNPGNEGMAGAGVRGPDSATEQQRDGLEVAGQVRKERVAARLFFVGQHSCA